MRTILKQFSQAFRYETHDIPSDSSVFEDNKGFNETS
jgi:hypothetical protein